MLIRKICGVYYATDRNSRTFGRGETMMAAIKECMDRARFSY